MTFNPSFWNGKRVLLTGHTGFKGSWLALWLQSMNAQVVGYALTPPTNPNLFEVAEVAKGMTSVIGDIRDLAKLKLVFAEHNPEVVIHMAAQPLVRQSYQNPVETYSTNVMGTVHLFEAVRNTPGIKAVVNVTSDKCYENKEWHWGYREDEPMGGYDPYSNSKACSELVTSAYRSSFFLDKNIALASARAGNVIGGGDWALDRLIPDTLRAFERSQSVIIRNPDAIRPWQHVLEPLGGYLVLAERLYKDGQAYSEGWNFGPCDDDARSVRWIVEHLASNWGKGASWGLDVGSFPHEANNLKLDISRAKNLLGWQPRWTLGTALQATTDWHRKWLVGSDMKAVTLEQINQYQLSTLPKNIQA
jgi:CDP-glucose 4,6-dehydratase